MSRQHPRGAVAPRAAGPGPALVVVLTLILAGCGDEPLPPPPSPPTGAPAGSSGPASQATGILSQAPAPAVPPASERMEDEKQTSLLKSVLRLVEEAPLNPGGKNFETATGYLNEYFEGTPASAFAMRPEAREFLIRAKLPPEGVADLERPLFAARDARHLEDCLLYRAIAPRIAGQGDTLTRVRRVFDWVVRQVQLVPPESLGVPGALPQAQARPYDVLVRAMATEQGGYWAERSWVFMVLLRQLDVDAGLITYAPEGTNPDEPRFWITGVLVDGKVYLFDARLGLEVPGPGGRGVATLNDVLAAPSLLDGLTLPGQGQPRYEVTGAELARGRLGIAIDSSLGYLSPRMRLLQGKLASRNRMVLFRDPAEQRDAFARAFGDRFAGAILWMLPIDVEVRLFTDSKFVEATQQPLMMYDPILPLLRPRLMQLRGELPAAIQGYVSIRYNPNARLNNPEKTPIPPQARYAIDMHATYFLALAQLEQGNLTQAENLFLQAVRFLTPQAGPPFYPLFHYGAETNLGRIYEGQGKPALAVHYYSEANPTHQGHGNLLRARDLVWADPFTPAEDPPARSTQGPKEAPAAAAVTPPPR